MVLMVVPPGWWWSGAAGCCRVGVACGRSALDEAGDGGGRLAQPLAGRVAALDHGLGDAVADVAVEQPRRHRLEGAAHRRDLGEDVDAVPVVLDHGGDALGLALDAPEALEQIVLGKGVAGHRRSSSIRITGYPHGV